MEELKKSEKSNSKSVICTLIIIILAVVAAAGGGIYYAAGYMNKLGLSKGSLSKDAAIELFNNAKSFKFRCKQSTLRDRTYISVGESWYGLVLDNLSIFNSQKYFYVGEDEELFHVGFATDWMPKNADKNLKTATTYELLSPKNEIIGHLQETVIERPGFSRDYYYVYYDKNDNEGEFYIRKGKLYDRNGNVAATAKIDNFGFFEQGIEISKEEEREIPYEEIFLFYMRCYAEWRQGTYSY